MKTQKQNIYSTDHINQEVIKFLSYLENEATTGKDCLQNSVLTKTASNVMEFFVNPVGALHKNYATLKQELISIVKNFMLRFFIIHNDLIYKVINEQNSLKFTVALYKDTIKNRRQFYNFLEHYESLDFSKDFPVYIQFVPPAIADKFDSKNIIQFVDGSSYSAS